MVSGCVEKNLVTFILMKGKTNSLKASRPCEYVAFFTMEVPSMEGPVFVYMACDAFSGFGFNTGAERDESPDNIIKHIYLLTEDKEFVRHRHKGFTLVLDRFEDLSDRIEGIIKGVNGTLLYNKSLHCEIAKPVRASFTKFTNKKERK